jgi:choline-sulfatase
LDGSHQTSRHTPVYGAYLDLQRAITEDGWKLIAYPKAKAFRLYHMAEDPQEMLDLANKPEHEAKLRQLFEALLKLAKSLNDPLDLRAAFAQP